MSDTYIKEEVGHIPTRMVVTAVYKGRTIWQKSICGTELEWARDGAARFIAKAQRQ